MTEITINGIIHKINPAYVDMILTLDDKYSVVHLSSGDRLIVPISEAVKLGADAPSGADDPTDDPTVDHVDDYIADKAVTVKYLKSDELLESIATDPTDTITSYIVSKASYENGRYHGEITFTDLYSYKDMIAQKNGHLPSNTGSFIEDAQVLSTRSQLFEDYTINKISFSIPCVEGDLVEIIILCQKNCTASMSASYQDGQKAAEASYIGSTGCVIDDPENVASLSSKVIASLKDQFSLDASEPFKGFVVKLPEGYCAGTDFSVKINGTTYADEAALNSMTDDDAQVFIKFVESFSGVMVNADAHSNFYLADYLPTIEGDIAMDFHMKTADAYTYEYEIDGVTYPYSDTCPVKIYTSLTDEYELKKYGDSMQDIGLYAIAYYKDGTKALDKANTYVEFTNGGLVKRYVISSDQTMLKAQYYSNDKLKATYSMYNTFSNDEEAVYLATGCIDSSAYETGGQVTVHLAFVDTSVIESAQTATFSLTESDGDAIVYRYVDGSGNYNTAFRLPSSMAGKAITVTSSPDTISCYHSLIIMPSYNYEYNYANCEIPDDAMLHMGDDTGHLPIQLDGSFELHVPEATGIYSDGKFYLAFKYMTNFYKPGQTITVATK